MTNEELEALKKDAARYRWLRDNKSCNFHLEHNPHRAVYAKVEEWLKDHHEGDPDLEYLTIVEGEREKMVASQDFWKVQDYERTPVGFYTLGAATLDVLIDNLMQE